MSRWRREASERLPELQSIIASTLVDNPMMLWVELNSKFGELCEEEQPAIDLLRRVWQYCDWCLVHGSDDVRTAAAFGFCEHLLDSSRRAELLPKIMSRADYSAVRNFMEYHNSPAEVDAWFRKLWPR